jgi:hypothetical protein
VIVRMCGGSRTHDHEMDEDGRVLDLCDVRGCPYRRRPLPIARVRVGWQARLRAWWRGRKRMPDRALVIIASIRAEVLEEERRARADARLGAGY